MELMDGILGRVRREDDGPPTHTEGDALVIDCRDCDVTPVPGSDECIRCMVGCASSVTGTERVILRTGRDIEISGMAGEAVRKAASMRRWSMADGKLPMYCRSCRSSRREVMDAVWEAFPKGAVAEGRMMLNRDRPDRDGCDMCLARTSAALDQIEADLAELMDDMASAGRTVR